MPNSVNLETKEEGIVRSFYYSCNLYKDKKLIGVVVLRNDIPKPVESGYSFFAFYDCYSSAVETYVEKIRKCDGVGSLEIVNNISENDKSKRAVFYLKCRSTEISIKNL